MSRQSALTLDEQKVNSVWQEHLRTEFSAHSADETIATMVANPLLNQVSVMIGGGGQQELHEFYAKYFLRQIPSDTEMVPVSRTIGQGIPLNKLIRRAKANRAGDVRRFPKACRTLFDRQWSSRSRAQRGQSRG
jgi:hypothetical protein